MSGVTQVTASGLLHGDAPDAPTVVVLPEDGSSPVLPVDLVDAHGGDPRLVTVAAAPADLDVGLQGALAGLGTGWAAPGAALRSALDHRPRSEAELRWLLWNEGLSVRRAPGAARTSPELPTGPLVADRIPLPAVRPWSLTQATVPTVTVLLHRGTDPAGPGDLPVLDPWPERSRVPFEVVIVGQPAELPDTGRIRGAPDVPAAVADARGALLWFVHGDVEAHREAWARVLRRLEDDRITWAQAAYELPDGTTRSSRGLLAADRALGAPAFTLVRRRQLRRRDGDPMAALAHTIATGRGTIVVSHPVGVPARVPARPVPTLRSLAAAARPLLRETARDLRDRATDLVVDAPTDPAEEPTASPDRPSVGWVGFSGNANFGDELVLRAARQLLPGVDVVPGGEGTHGTVLGGGTLLNADRFYQRIAHDIDAPGLARLVLGTGVVSPEIKGHTEPLAGWEAFLRVGPVGVRGPHSAAHLRAWAAAELPDWHGEVEVLGDPALVVTAEAPPVDGLVVLAPVGGSAVGAVSESDEQHQLELLLAAARAAHADGRPVSLLAAHPGDDRVLVALLRQLDEQVHDVVHAHQDLDAGLRLITAADLVIGTRLHALVAAAAAGTDFLGLAYRPKVADFAASVVMEDRTAPLAAWKPAGLVAALRAAPDQQRHEAMLAAVDEHRMALRDRVSEFLVGL